MKAHAAPSCIMIFSLASVLSRKGGGGGLTAFAFRHASTTAPIVRRPSPSQQLVVGLPRRSNVSGRYNGRLRAPSSHSSTRCFGSGANSDEAAATAVISDAVIIGSGTDADGTSSEEGTPNSETTRQNRISRRARKRNKQKMWEDAEESAEAGVLDWEQFDFGESPKMDKRFKDGDGITSQGNQTGLPDHVINTISKDSITYKSYIQSEAKLDDATSNESLRIQAELLSLSPDLVQRSIDALSPFVQQRRLERIDEVLNQRTSHTRFLFENPSNPSNVWACLRTLDSFGIQSVDVIVHSDSYEGKAAINQKRGMRTAMGSAMWMTIRQFGSLEEAVTHLREEEGCLIYASDLNPNAKDVRDLVWDVDFDDAADGSADGSADGDGADGAESKGKEQRPICIVMGNEDRGISDAMRTLADETFYLPMCGFAESFNLSVATAITLAYMSAVSSRGNDSESGSGGDGGVLRGPLRPGDMDPHERQCLRLKGVLNSLAQRRMGKALLKKEGIVLPESLYSSKIN